MAGDGRARGPSRAAQSLLPSQQAELADPMFAGLKAWNRIGWARLNAASSNLIAASVLHIAIRSRPAAAPIASFRPASRAVRLRPTSCSSSRTPEERPVHPPLLVAGLQDLAVALLLREPVGLFLLREQLADDLPRASDRAFDLGCLPGVELALDSLRPQLPVKVCMGEFHPSPALERPSELHWAAKGEIRVARQISERYARRLSGRQQAAR